MSELLLGRCSSGCAGPRRTAGSPDSLVRGGGGQGRRRTADLPLFRSKREADGPSWPTSRTALVRSACNIGVSSTSTTESSREVREELGIEPSIGPLLVVDWARPSSRKATSPVHLAGGTLAADQLAAIVRVDRTLRRVASSFASVSRPTSCGPTTSATSPAPTRSSSHV